MTTLNTPARDVGLLGDEPADARRVPRRVGRGLEDHGVAGGERLADLLDRDLEREVPRHDRADDARGLPHDRASPSVDRTRCRSGSSRSHSKWSIVLGRPEEAVLERRVELRAVGERDRGADLGDELCAQLLLLAHDRLVELTEALLAERVVGRPVGLVERAARGGDGALHVARPTRRRPGPSTSSVAGLMLSKRLPDAASTSSPSMSMRTSPCTAAGAVGFGGGHGGCSLLLVGAQR